MPDGRELPSLRAGAAQTASAPLLFLDFDGVLHPMGCDPSEDLAHLPRLESVLREQPSVRVVISSTWQDAYSLRTLRGHFSHNVAARIVGATREADPDGEAETRFHEIRAWLRHVGEPSAPWIALDDAAHEFPEGCRQLVLCDSAVGLDDEAADRLRAALLSL